VLYIHSKGITKEKYPAVQDWIDMMVYFLIERHEATRKLLDKFDTCGTNLIKVGANFLKRSATCDDVKKSYHYSGNFWWAKSTYLRTLDPKIGPKYLDPEFRIGSGNTKKMVSVWNSNANHYFKMYPRTSYADKPFKPIILQT